MHLLIEDQTPDPEPCPDPWEHERAYRRNNATILLRPAVRDAEEREAAAAGICIYCGRKRAA